MERKDLLEKAIDNMLSIDFDTSFISSIRRKKKAV